MYQILKKLLFKLDAEKSHYLTLTLLKILAKIKLLKFYKKPKNLLVQ